MLGRAICSHEAWEALIRKLFGGICRRQAVESWRVAEKWREIVAHYPIYLMYGLKWKSSGALFTPLEGKLSVG